MAVKIQKIIPFLWFDDNAEEAVRFYTSIFKNSKILQVVHYGEGMSRKAGTIMVINFLLYGQQLAALNGGPFFKFNESISFVIHCDNQQEIDNLWEKLCNGGSESQCGWLKDKFGLSWQIVPSNLQILLNDKDPKRSERVMHAILKMKKLDLKILRNAYVNKNETRRRAPK